MATKTATVSTLTKQLSNLDLQGKEKTTVPRQPALPKKMPSTSRLATKYAPTRDGGAAAPGQSTLVKMASGHLRVTSVTTKPAPGLHSRTNSTTSAIAASKTDSNLALLQQQQQQQQRNRINSNAKNGARPQSPVRAQYAAMDIGAYDGGFEKENEKRGSAVFGKAAELLALDSSRLAYVLFPPFLFFEQVPYSKFT